MDKKLRRSLDRHLTEEREHLDLTPEQEKSLRDWLKSLGVEDLEEDPKKPGLWDRWTLEHKGEEVTDQALLELTEMMVEECEELTDGPC